jgi:hypothetical protein
MRGALLGWGEKIYAAGGSQPNTLEVGAPRRSPLGEVDVLLAVAGIGTGHMSVTKLRV